MDDLAVWLLEQIAEDEQGAMAASPGPWTPNAEHDEVTAGDGIAVCDGFALSNNQLRATVDHIARHDPVRVLAYCAATRRLVRWVLAWPMRSAPPSSIDGVLETLALPYADRPGYRSEWRP